MYEEDRSPSNDYLSNASHRGDQSVSATDTFEMIPELDNIHAKSSRAEENGTDESTLKKDARAFRRVCGGLQRLVHPPSRYWLQPMVYYNGANYALAVIVDNRLMEKLLEKVIEGIYGTEVRLFKPRAIQADKNSIIEMEIKVKEPLHFEPPLMKLSQTLRAIRRTPRPIFVTSTLKGTESIPTKEITITYEVKVNAERIIYGSFTYPNPSFNAQQGETSRSRISVLTVMNQRNTMGTQVEIGGQYHESSTGMKRHIS